MVCEHGAGSWEILIIGVDLALANKHLECRAVILPSGKFLVDVCRDLALGEEEEAAFTVEVLLCTTHSLLLPSFQCFHKVCLGTKVPAFQLNFCENVDTGCHDIFSVLSSLFATGKLVLAGRERQHLGCVMLGRLFGLKLAVRSCSALHNAASCWGEPCLGGGAPHSSCLGQPPHTA